MEIKDLQVFQKEYDKKYWAHNWSEQEKIRHITLHMWMIMGKLSLYCERQEHKKKLSKEIIKDEVVPELLLYTLQLSNLYDIKDLWEAYFKKIKENISRIT